MDYNSIVSFHLVIYFDQHFNFFDELAALIYRKQEVLIVAGFHIVRSQSGIHLWTLIIN